MNAPDLLTMGEARRALGVAYHRLRYLIDSNQLDEEDFVRLGGRRHWRRSTLRKAAKLLGAPVPINFLEQEPEAIQPAP